MKNVPLDRSKIEDMSLKKKNKPKEQNKQQTTLQEMRKY